MEACKISILGALTNYLAVAQGPFWFWQGPARWVTHFLSWASKKENASKRKKTPEDTLGRVSSGRFRKQKGFGPFEILGVLDFSIVLVERAYGFRKRSRCCLTGFTGLARYLAIQLPSGKV